MKISNLFKMNNKINYKNNLISKLRSKKARIGVIGLGYVGLPLAILFAKEGSKFLVLILINIKLIELKIKKLISKEFHQKIFRYYQEKMSALKNLMKSKIVMLSLFVYLLR